MNELSIPDGIEDDPKATEILRLWAANKELNVSIKLGSYHDRGFDEAEAWGVIITDFARHVARGLSQRYGLDEDKQLEKIKKGFLEEIWDPTTEIKGE